MRYLLDTHTALWSFDETHRLSECARSVLADVSAELVVSIASAWEVAIKTSLGRLDFPGGVDRFLENVRRNGIVVLGVSEAALRQVESLPFFHCDPFDRLLVATAIAEGMTLLTADDNIRKYAVNWTW
jgi:PIN domain nuclease of toxin-antitoxin system